MLPKTKQQVYAKLQQQALLHPTRLYLTRHERQVYVDSLEEATLLFYKQKSRRKLSFRHPMYRGIRIYLEKTGVTTDDSS